MNSFLISDSDRLFILVTDIIRKMFGKGNFDGQYRSTPTVSIRGASKHENREQLLKRAHDERVSREADRRKATAILSIQSLVRGFLARRR